MAGGLPASGPGTSPLLDGAGVVCAGTPDHSSTAGTVKRGALAPAVWSRSLVHASRSGVPAHRPLSAPRGCREAVGPPRRTPSLSPRAPGPRPASTCLGACGAGILGGTIRALLSIRTFAVVALVVAGLLAASSPASAQAPAPRIASVRLSTTTLPAGGGVLQVTARVLNAGSCRVQTARSGALLVRVVQRARSCRVRPWRERLVVGANPGERAQLLVLRLLARGPGGSSEHLLRVRVARRLRRPPALVGTATVTSAGPPAPAPTARVPAFVSSSWAGEVLEPTAPVQRVSASWHVPQLSCTKGAGQVATWVGVDGVGGTAGAHQVFQAGTQSTCTGGVASDVVFWEWFPHNAVQPVAVVAPGDLVTASIWRSSSSGASGWWWSVTDQTTGQTFSAPQAVAYDGPAASAEWVVEDPLLNYQVPGAFAPFARFDPITFTDMVVAPAPVPNRAAGTWGMRRHGEVLATPSSPVSTGRGMAMTVTAGT